SRKPHRGDGPLREELLRKGGLRRCRGRSLHALLPHRGCRPRHLGQQLGPQALLRAHL
ncbi:uncharacterized protein METZ01_LOCUS313978, partial [marine metagenome]